MLNSVKKSKIKKFPANPNSKNVDFLENNFSTLFNAFQSARNARNSLNYTTQLIISDYSAESIAENSAFRVKSNSMFDYVKDLVERDCGVDGVGLEASLDIGFSDEDLNSISDNLKRYAEIGLKVHFTGIDVRCGRGGSQWSDCGITENEDWSEQMLANQSRVYTSLQGGSAKMSRKRPKTAEKRLKRIEIGLFRPKMT